MASILAAPSPMPSVKQGHGRIGLKSPCTSSNRLPWLWPYPWRQSATKLTLCFAGPSKCWRLGVCFPGEHSRLQSPLRSEEHTSELQSLRHLVCRLLLGKKNLGRQRHRQGVVWQLLAGGRDRAAHT